MVDSERWPAESASASASFIETICIRTTKLEPAVLHLIRFIRFVFLNDRPKDEGTNEMVPHIVTLTSQGTTSSLD